MVHAKYARVPPRFKGQGQAERVRRDVVALNLSSSDTIVLTGSDTEDVINNTNLVTGDLVTKKSIGNDVAVNLTTGVVSGLPAGSYKVSAFMQYLSETDLGNLSLKVKDVAAVEVTVTKVAPLDAVPDALVFIAEVELSGGNVTFVLADSGAGGTITISQLELLIEELPNVA